MNISIDCKELHIAFAQFFHLRHRAEAGEILHALLPILLERVLIGGKRLHRIVEIVLHRGAGLFVMALITPQKIRRHDVHAFQLLLKNNLGENLTGEVFLTFGVFNDEFLSSLTMRQRSSSVT